MPAIVQIGRGWQPSARQRATLVRKLAQSAGDLTTSALAEIEARHFWFGELDAEHRSWVTLVARAGIDGFVSWFADEGRDANPRDVFDAAPRALMRKITLNQSVDLIRTTIDTVEGHLERLVPRGDRSGVYLAIVQYSREIAFGVAEVYARAAEERGGWDARLEALVVDAVIRGEADETVLSRASALGWRSPAAITVTIGPAPARDSSVEAMRRAVADKGFDLLASTQGDRLVVVLGGHSGTAGTALAVITEIADHFGPGQIVVGPEVGDLVDAAASARGALSGVRAANAWPSAPRPVAAEDLLPERALAGDGHARRMLAREIYTPLRDAGSDLLESLVAYLDNSGSVEATARALFVHPNTVRYRLRRIAEVSGYHPADARSAYVLRLAVTLGRLMT
ncbi:helix-turn-helix domain-containing protein [Micropruina sp. KQZ13P-5]|nr:helix-turn-helix domain-containing protein [Micropruina sp. KQZ13P-5]MCW3157402.1 helix-turn-helix domain-containing protein [Micropruina sp. KQZ13P-5]